MPMHQDPLLVAYMIHTELYKLTHCKQTYFKTTQCKFMLIYVFAMHSFIYWKARHQINIFTGQLSIWVWITRGRQNTQRLLKTIRENLREDEIREVIMIKRSIRIMLSYYIIHGRRYKTSELSAPRIWRHNQWMGSSGARIMTCRLFGTKPLYKSMLSYRRVYSYETKVSEIHFIPRVDNDVSCKVWDDVTFSFTNLRAAPLKFVNE